MAGQGLVVEVVWWIRVARFHFERRGAPGEVVGGVGIADERLELGELLLTFEFLW